MTKRQHAFIFALTIAVAASSSAIAAALPSTEQIHKAVVDTEAAWGDWVAIWVILGPLVAQIPALFKGVQDIPGLGIVLKYIAGNWGYAENK